MTAVALTGLDFAWGRAGFRLTVPRLEIGTGERVLLTGASGSGKTSLLSLIAGIVTARPGMVRVLDSDPARLSGPARDRLRAERLGIVFQQFNLLPFARALDNVLLGLAFAPHRRRRLGPGAPAEARRLMADLGLDDPALAALPAARLSVGQQQRVAAARALIGGPDLVLADEPTSALDPGHRARFLDLLFAEAARAGAAVLCVSHDPALAPQFDRTLVLDQLVAAP